MVGEGSVGVEGGMRGVWWVGGNSSIHTNNGKEYQGVLRSKGLSRSYGVLRRWIRKENCWSNKGVEDVGVGRSMKE